MSRIRLQLSKHPPADVTGHPGSVEGPERSTDQPGAPFLVLDEVDIG